MQLKFFKSRTSTAFVIRVFENKIVTLVVIVIND